MSVAPSRKSLMLFLALVAPTLSAGDLKSKYDVIGHPSTPQQIADREAKYKAENEAKVLAKSACMRYIRNNINDPSSADFPDPLESGSQAQGVKQKNGRWKVTFTGRAKNQFNALILVKFQCIVEPIEDEGKQYLMIVSAKQLAI